LPAPTFSLARRTADFSSSPPQGTVGFRERPAKSKKSYLSIQSATETYIQAVQSDAKVALGGVKTRKPIGHRSAKRITPLTFPLLDERLGNPSAARTAPAKRGIVLQPS